MISLIWILWIAFIGFLVFGKEKYSFRGFPSSIKASFGVSSASERKGRGWVILLFLTILLSPLVVGLDFFLKTDANVLVVVFFLFWFYQGIKLVWNSEEKNP